MAIELKINKVHTGAKKSYNCNQCGFSCNRPSKLEIHLRVNSGGKAFVCSQRNYSCTEAGTLKVHMRIHSGENPYSWMQCDYSCSQTLERNPFACKKCEHSCRQAHELGNHMKKHTFRASTPAKWYISLILTLLCYNLVFWQNKG